MRGEIPPWLGAVMPSAGRAPACPRVAAFGTTDWARVHGASMSWQVFFSTTNRAGDGTC